MKAMKKVLALGLALAMVVTAVPVTSAEAATTKLNATKATLYVGGSSKVLKVTPASKKVTSATSSKKSVVTVKKADNRVRLYAVSAGTAKVTVKAGGKTLTANVTVKNPATRIKVDGKSAKNLEVAARDTVALTAVSAPKNADITFKSSNESVVTVDNNGTLTAVSVGTANVAAYNSLGGKYVMHVTVTPAVAVVDSVVATNATTIALTGKNLDLVTMNDVTVEGYSVKDYVVADDHASATVTLTSALTPNTEVKVKVSDVFDGTVTYKPAVEGISVKAATYKANTNDDQYLTVQMNGVDTTLAELKANGYTVTFYAYQYVNGTLKPANDFFTVGGTTNSSTDGKIAGSTTARTAGEYQVKVEAKGSTTMISDYTTIVLSNNDEVASAINNITIMDAALPAKFVQTVDASLNLKQDEQINVTAISVKTNYNDNAAGDVKVAAIKSDNSSSVTVEYDTLGSKWVITAHKAGSANLTVTYGTLTKVIPVTVDTTARSFSTIKVSGDKEILIGSTGKTAKAYAVDNHGAYMTDQDIYVEWVADNGAISGGALTVTGDAAAEDLIWSTTKSTVVNTDNDGKVTLTFDTTQTAGAQASFDFYKGTGTTYTGAKLATYTVKTVGTQNVSYAFSPVAQSSKTFGVTKNGNLDVNLAEDSRMVELQLKTSYMGIEKGLTTTSELSASDYKLEYDSSKIAVIDVDGNVDDAVAAVKTALQAGTDLSNVTGYVASGDAYVNDVLVVAKGSTTSTALSVKKAGEAAKASYAFNIVNTVPVLKDIKLATNALTFDVTTTIDYKNLLSISTTEDNPQIKNVTLAGNTKNYSEIRLCTNPGTAKDVYGNNLAVGDLYIVTGNGNLVLGALMLKQNDASAVGATITTGITVASNTKTVMQLYLNPASTNTNGSDNQYVASEVSVNN